MTERSRARGALLGLALGDALSWQALFHRSYAYPFWTRRLRREIDAASEDTGVVRPQIPFSLNQSPDGFAPGPTDDTEWAAFVMQTLLDADAASWAEVSQAAWNELAHEQGTEEPSTVRGSVSTHVALANLRKGLAPPVSGHDNPHYFDDGACARAVPFGVRFAGDPARAAQHAAAEAHVTNAAEGVEAARAVAAGISVACAGGSASDSVAAARAELPPGGWCDRTVAAALALDASSTVGLAFGLAKAVVNPEYNYGTTAPETLAVALALTVHVGGDFGRGVTAATAVPKAADAAAPLVGAFCGALGGEVAWPDASPHQLAGLCLPRLKGVDYLNLVDAWLDRSDRQPDG